MSFSKLPMKLVRAQGYKDRTGPHGLLFVSLPRILSEPGFDTFGGPRPERGFYEGEGDALC